MPKPSTDFEETSFTPEIGLSSGSNNWIIFWSISSAVAPGQSMVTATTSTSKSGKNCLLSLPIDKSPTTIIKIMIILAEVLCSTKNFKKPDSLNCI